MLRELERRVLLSVLDRKWREHLYEMDYLQEGIGLRAMAQRDPLVEYQREGFDMFAAMMDAIKEESVGFLFNLEVQVDEARPRPAEAGRRPNQVGAAPQLDLSLLKAAQAEHDARHQRRSAAHQGEGPRPRHVGEKPLVYSAPELGSETPSVQTSDVERRAGARRRTAVSPRGATRTAAAAATRSSKRKR